MIHLFNGWGHHSGCHFLVDMQGEELSVFPVTRKAQGAVVVQDGLSFRPCKGSTNIN